MYYYHYYGPPGAGHYDLWNDKNKTHCLCLKTGIMARETFYQINVYELTLEILLTKEDLRGEIIAFINKNKGDPAKAFFAKMMSKLGQSFMEES